MIIAPMVHHPGRPTAAAWRYKVWGRCGRRGYRAPGVTGQRFRSLGLRDPTVRARTANAVAALSLRPAPATTSVRQAPQMPTPAEPGRPPAYSASRAGPAFRT